MLYSPNMSTPNEFMTKFEAHTGLGPTFAARVLGLPYISYAQYRNRSRKLKACHRYHMEVLMLLDEATLKARIEDVLYGL